MREMEDRINGNFTSLQAVVASHGQQLELLYQSMSRTGGRVSISLHEPAPKPESQTVPQAMLQMEAADDRSPFQAPLHSHSQGSGQLSDPMTGILENQLSDNEGELSIPVGHTTAAHKLLMWPSIKRLLDLKQCDEDYVMRLEEERGLISVYGQGETSYTVDGSQLPFPSSSLEAAGAGTDRSYWRSNRDRVSQRPKRFNLGRHEC
jgi:hypothetical protein